MQIDLLNDSPPVVGACLIDMLDMKKAILSILVLSTPFKVP